MYIYIGFDLGNPSLLDISMWFSKCILWLLRWSTVLIKIEYTVLTSTNEFQLLWHDNIITTSLNKFWFVCMCFPISIWTVPFLLGALCIVALSIKAFRGRLSCTIRSFGYYTIRIDTTTLLLLWVQALVDVMHSLVLINNKTQCSELPTPLGLLYFAAVNILKGCFEILVICETEVL